MKSSIYTATALFGSASLIFGRPQDTPVQTEELAQDSAENLDTNPNAFIVPPPAQPTPSSFNAIPNLASIYETSGAVPETIPNLYASAGSTGVSTDDTQINTPPGEDSSKFASQAQVGSTTRQIFLTESVNTFVDSILSGQFTYGIFGFSNDLSKVVPYTVVSDKSWASFGWAVRKSRPGFALHLTDDGMLLLFTKRIQEDESSVQQNWQVLALQDIEGSIFIFIQGKVEEKYGKGARKSTYAIEVDDDYSLEDAINSHNQAESVHFSQQ